MAFPNSSSAWSFSPIRLSTKREDFALCWYSFRSVLFRFRIARVRARPMRRASPFLFWPSTSNFRRDQIDSKGLLPPPPPPLLLLLLAFTFMATPSGPDFLLFFFFLFESVLLPLLLRFDDFAMDFARSCRGFSLGFFFSLLCYAFC